MALKEDVMELLSKVLSVKKEELPEDKSLYESIGVDSTEMVELAVALSKHFGIEVGTNDIKKSSTPQEIVAIIENKKNN